MPIIVADICRYPVKGLSPEHLPEVRLAPGQGLPYDRRFAIAHGSTQYAPESPCWLPKTAMFTLLRDEKLAQLRVAFDVDSGVLTVARGGRQVARGRATDPMGRALIGEFFTGFLSADARGAPKLLENAMGFTDTREHYVSVVNLASVRDLGRVARSDVDPIRFRANLYLDGAPAWSEFDWTGREIAVGGARLRVVGPIDRCAATNVNPETAARDMNLPQTLQRGFGHAHMGVYAEVTAGATIALGDAVGTPA